MNCIKSLSIKSAFCGFVVLAGASLATAQNLIVNGSFENGITFSGYTPSGSVAPWVLSGNIQIAYWQGASNGINAVVFNGGDAAPIGAIAQSFPTTPGAEYKVSFDYGAVGWNSGQSVAVLVTGAGATPLISQVVTIPSTGAWAGGFTTFTYTFTADGNQATVAFQDQPTNGTVSQDGMLDNVSVVLAPDTKAPTVTATLVNVSKGGDDESSQFFRVVASATDNVGVTSLTATLNGVTVTNGQIVQLQLIKSGAQSTKRDDGRLQIKATSFSLSVKASDRAGNNASATATAVFNKNGKEDEKKDEKKEGKKEEKKDDRKS